MPPPPPQLKPLLKRYFGFDTFRPLQEEIVRDSLAGRDVLALLPTGGGKSLCYQLAALARGGLAIVVSPLIALMKDQVDSLTAAGVPATFLNSSLKPEESRARLRGVHNREYRLLYVAPERLVLSGFMADLERWNVTMFAIDEAHCISEWGHDFRPEYRQLATLRGRFPRIPFMALTATATERVRADIASQLRLHDPALYVASFNRPNLTYRVAPKAGAYDQILAFIRKRNGESGIIYCQARKTADSLASRLVDDGLSAAAYHAGLSQPERSRSQENFIRDKTQVICATIAFGMGINKPNVRFVLHHDLPKNIEGYYQETGRAGRDGIPSECLLLYSSGDRVKYGRFIDEMTNPAERDAARAQLEQMIHFAEAGGCRRSHLLDYFGEAYPQENCGACDNCLNPRETWDGTLAAQKFLSCVYRIREKSGFGVGVGHVVEVLTGASTERIRKWGHDTLSTYGIGAGHTRAQWGGIGRELVRLGLLSQDAERFNVLDLTPEGRDCLRARKPVTLTRPVAMADDEPERESKSESGRRSSSSGARRAVALDCDAALFERLRQLRRELAEQRDVPPYVIFSDVSLRHMARLYPTTPDEFRQVSGVGERKLADFGESFMEAIRGHVGASPKQAFAPEPAAAPARKAAPASPNGSVRETLALHREGLDVDTIASRRGFVPSTILGHLILAAEWGEKVDLDQILPAADQRRIAAALATRGSDGISAVVESLGGSHTYSQVKLFIACHQIGS